MTESIFKNYLNEVTDVLDGNPNKRKAIFLNENPPPRFDGAGVVSRLYESLACDGWKTATGKNWEWRTKVPSYKTTSPEVALEREIVASDTTNKWSCQMSTSSGIQGSYLNKRRAIDLVRQTAPDQYAFIELKVNSDNPLYAAFEILGYALAYQHARSHDWQGTGYHNVMSAKEINLIVLGPREWYQYKKGMAHPENYKFNYDWLSNGLTEGLNILTNGDPEMSLSFGKFTDFGDPNITAVSIVSGEVGDI